VKSEVALILSEKFVTKEYGKQYEYEWPRNEHRRAFRIEDKKSRQECSNEEVSDEWKSNVYDTSEKRSRMLIVAKMGVMRAQETDEDDSQIDGKQPLSERYGRIGIPNEVSDKPAHKDDRRDMTFIFGYPGYDVLGR
jgi:hypothetical protein